METSDGGRCVRVWQLLTGACLAAVLGGAARAECVLPVTESVNVAEAVDAETLLLDDGRKVRLVNLLSPRRPLWLEADRPWPAAEAAHKALQMLTAGQRVALALDERGEDRHGRLLAQVFLERGDGRLWVQGEMVDRGHGRAWSLVSGRACVEALIAREAAARDADAGLWRLGFYRVREATQAEEIVKLKNTFAIVEGKVLKVAQVGARTYLNFEEDWRRDFTVTVRQKAVKLFAGAGRDPASMEGTRVRVRGWVEWFNGPMIEVTHPEQIERLNE